MRVQSQSLQGNVGSQVCLAFTMRQEGELVKSMGTATTSGNGPGSQEEELNTEQGRVRTC